MNANDASNLTLSDQKSRPHAGAEPAGSLLQRATALAPYLRERAAEIERQRRLPNDVVDALRDIGVFRMGFPGRWGGLELSSMEQTEVIEALAYGDASAGWCAMIGSDTGLYALFLEEPVARAMFPHPDMITAGLLFPVGRADQIPGGYRLSGRWQFASGITHCDWVASGAVIYHDGQPEPGLAPGSLNRRIMLLPREQVQIIDTWCTTGLAGSGSCDYVVDDAFVPEEHTFRFDAARSGHGPLAQPEAFMRNMPGVPLGVARAALDYVRELATTRRHPVSGVAWAQDYRMQVTLARCEADFLAARSAVYGSMHQHWSLLAAGASVADLTPTDRAASALARLHAFRTARTIVQSLYDLLQTGAIFTSSPMDRWLRDITTMCQHVVAQDRILQSAGAHLVGATPDFPLCLGLVT